MNPNVVIAPRTRRPFWLAAALLAGLLTGLVAGCANTLSPFDSAAFVRQHYRTHVPPEDAQRLEVPFELDEPLRQRVHEELRLSLDEERRAEQVQEFIFNRLELVYDLSPTRNATQTFRDQRGNCLSFTNLFVGIARELRLNPFYVEVTDYSRWSYRNGLVVSQGHIVAGMRIDGKLRTYDFLPYRPKSYKEFKPIDDFVAAAHYFNNLGAEALMAGQNERALELVTLATQIAPDFTKAINNRGVCLARMGRLDDALAAYRQGLTFEPENVAILTNMVRVHQELGHTEEAEKLIEQIDSEEQTNPYFFIYQADLALSQNRPERALELMRSALSRDTELPEVHLGLTRVYMALGEIEKAKHHLARALKLDATNREALELAEILRDK